MDPKPADLPHDRVVADYLERQQQAAENKARAHAQWKTPAVPNPIGKLC